MELLWRALPLVTCQERKAAIYTMQLLLCNGFGNNSTKLTNHKRFVTDQRNQGNILAYIYFARDHN